MSDYDDDYDDDYVDDDYEEDYDNDYEEDCDANEEADEAEADYVEEVDEESEAEESEGVAEQADQTDDVEGVEHVEFVEEEGEALYDEEEEGEHAYLDQRYEDDDHAEEQGVVETDEIFGQIDLTDAVQGMEQDTFVEEDDEALYAEEQEDEFAYLDDEENYGYHCDKETAQFCMEQGIKPWELDDVEAVRDFLESERNDGAKEDDTLARLDEEVEDNGYPRYPCDEATAQICMEQGIKPWDFEDIEAMRNFLESESNEDVRKLSNVDDVDVTVKRFDGIQIAPQTVLRNDHVEHLSTGLLQVVEHRNVDQQNALSSED